MLSVLPGTAEAACAKSWRQKSRKRPRTPSCLGQYQSASARAKRLRQELLRLRQWEQRVQQEKTGASEGQADSCDPSFEIEPPQPQYAYPSIYRYPVEDALESTYRAVHGSPHRACVLTSQPALLANPQSHPGSRVRTSTTNPSDPNTPLSLTVHKFKKIDVSSQLASSSGLPSTALCSGTLASLHGCECAESEGEMEDDSWSNESLESLEHALSGSANPLGELAPARGSDGVSVRQPTPSHVWDCEASGEDIIDVEGSTGGAQEEAPGGEEDLPREETSQGSGQDDLKRSEETGECGDAEDFGLGGEGQESGLKGEANAADEGSSEPEAGWVRSKGGFNCFAGKPAAMFLPSLPPRFLGMPMPQRLRLLQFFTEAAEFLGLGIQSVYLASVMLDCCWVEARVRQVEPLPSGGGVLGREDLHVSALACLLHAYLTAKKTGANPRSVEAFCRLLHSASLVSPKVASMLPVRAGALEQHLVFLRFLMPLAAAEGRLSAFQFVYGSMLELRGECTQKQHLVGFVTQLWAAGFQKLPQDILGCATCCLLSGAVLDRHADGGEGPGCADAKEHHLQHLKDLHAFLCADVDKESGMEQGTCELPASGDLNRTRAVDPVEASVEVSV